MAVMDEVVVTATKTEEKRKDIPNAVVLVDAFDLQESSARTLGEYLSGEPGIDWRTYGNYGGAPEEIHIRGMSGNATQVLVNGVSVNSPSFGSADVSKIPLNSIERIEVVKGSGSLLYGSGAMGGTVNIITKRPHRDRVDLKAGAGGGTQGAYRLSAENGMFVAGDFGYYLTAGRYGTDGFRSNSDLVQNDATAKLVYDAGDRIDLSLYGDVISRDYGSPNVQPPSGTRPYTLDGLTVYDSESADLLGRAKDLDTHLVLNARSRPFSWLAASLRLDATNQEALFDSRYVTTTSFVPLVNHVTGSNNRTTNRIYGGEGNLDFRPLDGASLLVGGELKRYDYESHQQNLSTDGTLTPTGETTTTAAVDTGGAYAEAQYRPFRYAKFLAGYRHEHHSTFGGEDLYRLGVVGNPWEQTTLKVSTGKHFRAPTPNDLFYPFDGFARGNPNLMPETGVHTDATVEQSLLDERLFLTLTYFHWDVDNKIIWGPDSNGIWQPENLRSFTADGAEVGAVLKPAPQLVLSFYYTYTDAEEENKAYTRQQYPFPPFVPADFRYDWVTRRAQYTPEHQFKGTVKYWFDFGLTASATVRAVSDRVWYRTETAPAGYPFTETTPYTLSSYWTADFKLEQRLSDHWLVSLEGTNVFDKGYDTYFGTFTQPVSGTTSVTTYPGAGRSFFAGISYEY